MRGWGAGFIGVEKSTESDEAGHVSVDIYCTCRLRRRSVSSLDRSVPNLAQSARPTIDPELLARDTLRKPAHILWNGSPQHGLAIFAHLLEERNAITGEMQCVCHALSLECPRPLSFCNLFPCKSDADSNILL